MQTLSLKPMRIHPVCALGLAFIGSLIASGATAAARPPTPPLPAGTLIVVPETFLITRVLSTGEIPARHYQVVVEIPQPSGSKKMYRVSRRVPETGWWIRPRSRSR